jgi:hypothetical protein
MLISEVKAPKDLVQSIEQSLRVAGSYNSTHASSLTLIENRDVAAQAAAVWMVENGLVPAQRFFDEELKPIECLLERFSDKDVKNCVIEAFRVGQRCPKENTENR